MLVGFLLFSQLNVHDVRLCFHQNLWQAIADDVPMIIIRQQIYKR